MLLKIEKQNYFWNASDTVKKRVLIEDFQIELYANIFWVFDKLKALILN